MKYCRYCGTKLSDNAIYCSSCGKRILKINNSNQGVKPKEKKTCFVLGILSICFAIPFPFIGAILGIIGLFKDKTNTYRVYNLIGSIVSLTFYLVYMLIIFIRIF